MPRRCESLTDITETRASAERPVQAGPFKHGSQRTGNHGAPMTRSELTPFMEIPCSHKFRAVGGGALVYILANLLEARLRSRRLLR